MNGKIMFIWNPHVIEHITNAKISLLGSGVMGVPSGIVETFFFRAMAVAEKVACPAARKPPLEAGGGWRLHGALYTARAAGQILHA